MSSAITTTSLTKRYGSTRAVDELSLEISAGSVYGFLGPNGAGKSTTMQMLTALIEPTSGDGTIMGMSIRDRRAIAPHIGYLPETPPLYDELSGREQLDYVADLRGISRDRRERDGSLDVSTGVSTERSELDGSLDVSTGVSTERSELDGSLDVSTGVSTERSELDGSLDVSTGVSTERAIDRIEELLQEFDLASDAGKRIDAYSKGMCQKVAFIQSILHDPDVLFLDEPTSGLDPRVRRTLKERIRALADSGTTIFLSTHILSVVDELADVVGVLNNGRLVAEGTPDGLKRRVEAGTDGTLEDVFLDVTSTQRWN
jgi:ABC-type multidrug transport system ATPase subunit